MLNVNLVGEMEKQITISKNVSVRELTNYLISSDFFRGLNLKVDQSEKDGESPFRYFNDYEVLYYYCHQQKNVDQKKNIAPGTRREYLRELLSFAKNIVQYASDIEIDIEGIREGSLFKSLSPRHVKRYQEWMVEVGPKLIGKEKYSPATVARKTTIIKSFLKFLYENQYIENDLTTRMGAATVNIDDRPNRDLGPHEAIELLDFFKKENHPILFGILHVLITCGIRNTEFCNARVCDLSYDYVSGDYYLDINGKGNKRRLVPVKMKVFQSIVEFRKARGLKTVLDPKDTSPLFINADGNPYRNSYLSRYINKAVQRTGLDSVKNRVNPISPHTFRHAFAIISYHSGADIYSISRSLGHSKLDTTMIYLQKEFEKKDHALHKWSEGIMAEYL